VGRKAPSGAFAFSSPSVRTFVYIDGFNFYYGAVKGTAYKWLDFKSLFSRILKPYNQILAIKYYTAMVSARPGDPDAPNRQTVYLNALKAHIPELEVTLGHFLQSTVRMMRADPAAVPRTVEVVKTEEKGSDVNLALHVLNDAWLNKYDCAVICSNDSDLSQALMLIRKQHRKKIILAVPGHPSRRPATIQLKRYADAVIRITEDDLRASLLPNVIPGTRIHKPPTW
jgi:uncharacterized LabA/DUF88 family protein